MNLVELIGQSTIIDGLLFTATEVNESYERHRRSGTLTLQFHQTIIGGEFYILDQPENTPAPAAAAPAPAEPADLRRLLTSLRRRVS